DLRQGRSALDDEFVLDIDLDESPEPSPAEPAFSAATFRDRESYRSLPKIQSSYASAYGAPATISSEPATPTDTLSTPVAYERVVDDEIEATDTQFEPQQIVPQYSAPPSVQATPASGQELSPEMIDAIARRAVEQLSEKVIQEIAWEVVPQLAELLIKRQLEEKNS
ncbi:MAG TPA: hypothetical protein VE977_08085, partial [Pyrinomonadaceae bacterium]|nr:hypothetical protein [Pyrinomonadaceae bacterium]